MADGIRVEIVSPERLVLSGQSRSVTVPGTEGYFTVMADHAPMMTTLRPGFITVVDQQGTGTIFFVRGGFADVTPEGLTILAEQATTLSEFDRASLEAEIREAEAELAQATSPEEKSYAQDLVSALLNLLMEAGQIGDSAHVH
jgi:F-type H+-transporting ATPase subunit epsilon